MDVSVWSGIERNEIWACKIQAEVRGTMTRRQSYERFANFPFLATHHRQLDLASDASPLIPLFHPNLIF